jgi:hypothetical protein
MSPRSTLRHASVLTILALGPVAGCDGGNGGAGAGRTGRDGS